MKNSDDHRLIKREARRRVLAIGGGFAALLIGVCAWKNPARLPWAVSFSLLGLLLLGATSTRRRRYYTPLIMAILYLFGYMLAMTEILIQHEALRNSINCVYRLWPTLDDDDFLRLTIVIACGMLGILAATRIAEVGYGCLSKARTRNWHSSSPSGRLLVNLTIVWFWGSLLLMGLMWSIGVGRGGLRSEILLPFKLTGTMLFVRNWLVPLGGCFLLQLCFFRDRKQLTYVMFVLLLVVGLVGAFTSMSRGFFVVTISPGLLYIFLTRRPRWLKGKVYIRLVVAVVLLLIVAVHVVNSLRDVGYSGKRMDVANVLSEMTLSDAGVGAASLFSLAAHRVLGIRGLVPICVAPAEDISAPFAVFVGDTQYIEGANYRIFHLRVFSNRFTAFGMAYGMWGMLFLSGSYLVVFLGTAFFTLYVLFLEHLFLARGMPIVAVGVALSMALGVWEAMQLWYMWRAALMVFLLCFFVDVIRRHLPRVQTAVEWSCADVGTSTL